MANPDCCGPDEVPNVELFDRPPCFADSDCWTWENPYNTSPPGLYQGSPKFHPASPLYCRNDNDGTGIDIRLTGEPSTIDALSLADDSCFTTQNPLRRVLETNGNISLTSLPVATSRSDETCDPACEVILEGESGEFETGCSNQLTTTITNDGCWPMRVARCIKILGAEMENVGPSDEVGQYLLSVLINGDEQGPFPVMSSNGTGSDDDVTNYSGTICLPDVTLNAGDTMTMQVQPQMTWITSGSPTTTRINWGQVCASIVGESIINADTIAVLEVT